jgi:aminomethyltransferase
MVPFGGWEMPLSYREGTVNEHKTCRTDAVMFDVSHLGTVRVEGSDAFDRLQYALSNDLRKIAPGRAQYTHACNDAGGVEDDIIVWWLKDQIFDVMPNASNTERIIASIGGVDTTAQRAVLAVQGPQARERLAEIAPVVAAVLRFRVQEVEVLGAPCVVAGTGYTGEDGVEIAIPVAHAPRIAAALQECGIAFAGLGARDTLRLEAALPLYGHELGSDVSPLEADLGWVIGWEKGDFRGIKALENQRSTGVSRLLCGIRTRGRRPPRDGSRVTASTHDVGVVTSGNFSPMLECGIALAFLDVQHAVPGTSVQVHVRDSVLDGEVVDTPFVHPTKVAPRKTAND